MEPAGGRASCAAPPPAVVCPVDRNNEGHLQQQEMQEYEQLSSHWTQLDQNRDQRIDRPEFAAFERQMQQQGRTPQQGGGQTQ